MRPLVSLGVVVAVSAAGACRSPRPSTTPAPTQFRLDSVSVQIVREGSTYFLLLTGTGRADTVPVRITASMEGAEVFGTGQRVDSAQAIYSRSQGSGHVAVQRADREVILFSTEATLTENDFPKVEDFTGYGVRFYPSGGRELVSEYIQRRLMAYRVPIRSRQYIQDADAVVITWYVDGPREPHRNHRDAYLLKVSPHANPNCSVVALYWTSQSKGHGERTWRTTDEDRARISPAVADIERWFSETGSCR